MKEHYPFQNNKKVPKIKEIKPSTKGQKVQTNNINIRVKKPIKNLTKL